MEVFNTVIGGGIVAVGVFALNLILNNKLLRQENKNEIIDLLIALIDKQHKLYIGYGKGLTSKYSTMINLTFTYTKINALLNLVNQEYKFKNMEKTENDFMKLYMLLTSDDFSTPSIQKNINTHTINRIENDLHISLLENKV